MLPPNSDAARKNEQLYEMMATLDAETSLLGPCHEQTLRSVNTLAVAFWESGEIEQAITLLEQALDHTVAEHPTRVDLLDTLGKIMFDQRHLEQAAAIQREVLACVIEQNGANHAKSLSAQGDLAAVLFGLGEIEEANWLQQQAFERARTHLGKMHYVTSVLAWNCSLNYEQQGATESAQRIVVGELVWLLAEEGTQLDEHQNAIRGMLAERLHWNDAKVC